MEPEYASQFEQIGSGWQENFMNLCISINEQMY